MESKKHWESIYQERAPEEVSWFQPDAATSLQLIRDAASRSDHVLDVGGGASTLTDGLLKAGFTSVSVLDLSRAALFRTRERLAPGNARVNLIEADVLNVPFVASAVDVWHDRAVFHFLTREVQRERYIQQVRQIVRSGGLVLVATFAEDGPTKCSGLPVIRCSADQLHGVFGADFVLLSSVRENHVTPRGAKQSFVYCLCRYEPVESSDISISNHAA
jgi:SAM-dependent methyltransferase